MSELYRGKIEDLEDESEAPDTVVDDSVREMIPQADLVRFAPYLNALREAVLKLSQKHDLGLNMRIELRQKLLNWLENRLNRFPNFPIELIGVAFETYGEKFAQEIVLKMKEEKETLTLDIIVDVNGRITDI